MEIQSPSQNNTFRSARNLFSVGADSTWASYHWHRCRPGRGSRCREPCPHQQVLPQVALCKLTNWCIHLLHFVVDCHLHCVCIGLCYLMHSPHCIVSWIHRNSVCRRCWSCCECVARAQDFTVQPCPICETRIKILGIIEGGLADGDRVLRWVDPPAFAIIIKTICWTHRRLHCEWLGSGIVLLCH